MKIEFYKHNIGPEEKQSVNKILDSVFLTTGEAVDQFERDLAHYVGAQYCVGLMSCTAALHLALLALNVGPGDEVITTPLTFVATSTAIIHAGAKPVWVDVEEETGNINVDLIEEAITEKTRAIIPVHLYGQMCDMQRIRKIADKHGLFVVEDAAHALESERDGIRVGQLGDAACFSFYATKSITSGEGGAVVINSHELAEKIRILRQHGINKEAADRYTKEYEHWDLLELGWKYNMSDIQAALLIPQLRKVEHYWKRREYIYKKYRNAFSKLRNIEMPEVYPNSKSGYHLFTLWVEPTKRDVILKRLQEKGIGVAVNYRAINLLTKFQQLFAKGRGSFSVAERIGDSTISLPLYPKLKDSEVDYVIDSLKDILNE
ncbi:DegT/DnrJ/EryC1/StrS family aminotransferase [bacterium]|nr:DegT/DnrJ/EryC1/StrS family aminotransferase [bacterium]